MTANALRDMLHRIQPVDDGAWIAFSRLLRKARLRPREHALHAGEVERCVRFVMEGIVRQYYTRNGQEHNKEIYLAPSMVSAYTSFLTREPSPYAVQAVSEVEMMTIGRDELERLYLEHPAWERVGRLVVEGKYIMKERREALLLMASAEERYRWLVEAKPELLRHLNLYEIASYLGLTPETLSRVRARLARSSPGPRARPVARRGRPRARRGRGGLLPPA